MSSSPEGRRTFRPTSRQPRRSSRLATSRSARAAERLPRDRSSPAMLTCAGPRGSRVSSQRSGDADCDVPRASREVALAYRRRMFAIARTFALIGVDGRARPRGGRHRRRACPSFTIVGLPDAAVRESRERVRSALRQLGLQVPAAPDHREPRAGGPPQGRPGLRPGDRGGAPGRRPASCRAASLDRLRAGRRAGARRRDPAGARRPGDGGGGLRGARHARRRGSAERRRARPRWSRDSRWCRSSTSPGSRELAGGGDRAGAASGADPRPARTRICPDLSDLRGHPALRRCLEIAAAGAHSLLLIGPPGGGKTLALQRLPVAAAAAEPQRGDRGDPDRRRLRRERRRRGCGGRFGRRTTRSPGGPWSAAGRRRGPGR